MAGKSAKGFGILCPYCLAGDEEELTIDPNDLRRGGYCSGCGKAFTLEEARDRVAAQLARWELFIEWISRGLEMIEGRARG